MDLDAEQFEAEWLEGKEAVASSAAKARLELIPEGIPSPLCCRTCQSSICADGGVR